MGISNANIEAQPVLEQREGRNKSGCRFTLIIGSVSILIVFIINLSVTIWAIKLPTGNEEESTITSRRIIYEGSCSTSKQLNVVLHLLINVFSSILLAASSYCMQCLSAPTREEVDKAHAQGKWMDIGILSPRNLRRISGKRTLLWVLLAVSSLPLHLLYNSVVFASLSIFDYTVHELDTQVTGNRSSTIEWMAYRDGYTRVKEELRVGELYHRALESNWDGWDNLTALECVDAYATGFQTARTHAFLGYDEILEASPEDHEWLRVSLSSGELRGSCRPSPFDWICEDPNCSVCRDQLPLVRSRAQSGEWAPLDHPVRFCLSKPVQQICRVNFSIFIATAILGANLLKALILVYVAFSPPNEPLFVLGDAIQTFLRTPDPHSKDMCLASTTCIKASGTKLCSGPQAPSLSTRRWASAISSRRWIISAFLYCLALGTTAFFLGYGVQELVGSRDIKTLWDMGFGAVSETALITGMSFAEEMTRDNETLISVFFANLPQLSFSILYFQYNGLFTCMLLAKEWSDFGRKRKPLRVSSKPVGAQRSQYFLQLPYRFGVPLIIISIVIHWMLSQSIFLVVVETATDNSLDAEPPQLEWAFATCGYSPIAIIFVIIASALMVVWVVTTACLKLPKGIPIVGSCSLAIAAACHHPEGVAQPDAPLVPLKWGVMGDTRTASGCRHCGLSSEDVGELQTGEEYM